MRILRIMLVIVLMLANYTAAQAFGGAMQCCQHMNTGSKMMDCCKDQGGKPMNCADGSCDGCMVSAPAAITADYTQITPPLTATPEALPAPMLSHRAPTPEFRPPDFLA
jgi:hypothetical protein